MKLYTTLCTALCLLVFAACSPSKKEDKRIITVTIEPLRYFTEQIAGSKFKVETMVPLGSNPETYEPTAQQMINLSHSDMYIKVGSIGFERTWMKKLETNAPHTILIDSSEGIIPIESCEGHADPHTWMSCRNAIIIANNIYKALAQIDKADSMVYKANLETLINKIRTTDAQVRANLTKEKATSFMIYHPILTHFSDEYDLHQISVEDHGREPSAAQLKGIIEKAKKEKARVMFVQKEFANRNTGIVANSVGAEVIEINPLSYDWNEEMVKIATCLK